jgi:hypothetical protein
VVVPDRDPRELLVAGNEVQVSTVGRESPSVVVESVNLVIRLRNTTDAISPTIISVFVLVDVVAKMHNVVYRVLSKITSALERH